MNASLESVANSPTVDSFPDGLRAFTFWILETLYAVDISKVLTISQDLSKIQSIPSNGKGLLGMIEFQKSTHIDLTLSNIKKFEPTEVQLTGKLFKRPEPKGFKNIYEFDESCQIDRQ